MENDQVPQEMLEAEDAGAGNQIPAICLAAQQGNLQLLAELIASGADVNQWDAGTVFTPLHYAVQAGHIHCVEYLLGISTLDINSRTDNDKSALHLAVISEHNSFELVKLLVDHGADVDIMCDEDQGNVCTPFQLACQQSSKDVVEYFLIKKGSDILLEDIKWIFSNSALNLNDICSAFISSNADIVDLLREYVAKWNFKPNIQDEIEFATTAMRSNKLDVLKSVFEKYGQNIMDTDRGYWLLAESMNVPECFNYLLQSGCKVYCVRAGGRVDVNLELLLKVREDDGECYRLALSQFTPEIVQRCNENILDGGRRMLPLHRAINDGNIELTADLLDLGFDPRPYSSLIDFEGDVLYNFAVCGRLIYAGFHPGTVTYGILTCCLLAYSNHNDFCVERMLQLLIDHGADARPASVSELTPLVVMALIDSPSCETLLPILERAGAEMNYRRANSPFRSSDVVIAASLSGNASLLEYVVKKTCTQPSLIISDLLRIPQNVEGGPGYDPFVPFIVDTANSAQYKDGIRKAFGSAVLALLKFLKKSPALLALCEQVKSHFETPGEAHTDSDQVWEEVIAEFETIDTLKHMSRFVINDQLNAHDQRDHKEKINSLPIPFAMKEYLMFEEVIATNMNQAI